MEIEDRQHLAELMRRSNIYDTMPREQLVHRLDIFERRHSRHDRRNGLTPDDEATLSEMAEGLLRN